jgi:hypothetical protein
MREVIGRRQLSRRAFLHGSARVALAIGAHLTAVPAFAGPRAGAAGSAARGVAGSSVTNDALAELAARLTGPVLLPGDPDYATIAQPNNLRYASVLLLAIARCESPQDVSQAIR